MKGNYGCPHCDGIGTRNRRVGPLTGEERYRLSTGSRVRAEKTACVHGYRENTCPKPATICSYSREYDWHPKTDNGVIEERKEKPVTQTGSALVRPDEISDAIDSRDLLDRLVVENTARITKKVEKRVLDAWLIRRKQELRSEYIDKARKAYEKMWAICGNGGSGHHHQALDIRGYTIHQCEDCRYATYSRPYSGALSDNFAHDNQVKVANDMNNDLIKSLADRMIEVDIEAGLFNWPTEQDYPNIVDPNKKKRRIFG